MIIGASVASYASPSGQNNNLKVAAIVNDYPVTMYDIGQRMQFIMLTTGIKTDSKTTGQLANRVLNNLIDEQLQLQESKNININITDAEIDAAIAKIEADNKKEAGSLLRFLDANKIDIETLKQQLSAQIVWGRYIQRKIVPKLQVSDSELNRHIEQYMQKQRKVEEVLVATIDIPNLNIISQQFGQDDAGGLAAKLTEQLRNGVDFQTLAKQLSTTSTEPATTPTWIPIAQMPPPLATVVRATNAPAFLDPFQTVNGYQIIFIQEKRLGDYQMNAEATFKEIILHLKADATKQDVDLLMNIAKNVRNHSGSCNKLDVSGVTDLETLDFEVKYLRANLSEISPQIFPLVRGLNINETSEPFASPDGIRLLKLCEKTETPISNKLKERITVRLKQEKLQLEAVRALRELRRHAFIDVRE